MGAAELGASQDALKALMLLELLSPSSPGDSVSPVNKDLNCERDYFTMGLPHIFPGGKQILRRQRHYLHLPISLLVSSERIGPSNYGGNEEMVSTWNKVFESSKYLNKPLLPFEEWNIDFSELTVGTCVGIGFFGEVFHGIWNGTDVAIKIFFEQDLTTENMEDFCNEISILSHLRHPNVILFLGVCTTPHHLSMVTEYMEWGSLYHLIHMSGLKKKLSWRRRLKMLRDICRLFQSAAVPAFSFCSTLVTNFHLDCHDGIPGEGSPTYLPRRQTNSQKATSLPSSPHQFTGQSSERIGPSNYGGNEEMVSTWNKVLESSKYLNKPLLPFEEWNIDFSELTVGTCVGIVILFLGVCTKPPHLLMVTEYMDWGSLYHLIHMSGQKKKLSWRRRLKILRDICREKI
ncbi:hypothetical protein NE237_000344 [Protea cynaroides]|uniref:non-specific serine/threonine protein kinase n=1 Tax=Protea cynaroides TaxID=273540 RepID=A0A9Q0QX40_9MAGN|nr:hypothetical protein NE237_000344 [Protea cynaroides]